MDSNLSIVKKLTDSDVSHLCRLTVPKQKSENILKKMGITMPRNGIQVEVKDDNKSYWVNFNCNHSYNIGAGWKTIRDARGLKKDDVIQLYWKDTKFIFSVM